MARLTVSQLAERLELLESRLTGVETRLSAIESRLDTNLNYISKQLNDLHTRITNNLKWTVGILLSVWISVMAIILTIGR